MRRPTFKRVLLAGLLSGLASGIAGNLLAAAISSVTRQSFFELSPWPIGIVAVLAHLGGGAFFYGLARWTPHPTRHFAAVAILVAALNSLVVWRCMPEGFTAIAAPVHFLNALIAIWMIPRLSLAERASQR